MAGRRPAPVRAVSRGPTAAREETGSVRFRWIGRAPEKQQGDLGGAIGPLVMGYSVQWFGSWSIPLLITSGVYILGGVFALLVNPANQPSR